MAHGEEFLIVVPPVWTAFTDSETWFPQWDMAQIRDFIARESWGELDGLIEATGQIPAGKTVSNGRLVEATGGGGEQPQLWLQFIVIPPDPV